MIAKLDFEALLKSALLLPAVIILWLQYSTAAADDLLLPAVDFETLHLRQQTVINVIIAKWFVTVTCFTAECRRVPTRYFL